MIEEKTNNGESFTQFFGVPDDFTDADLEAWFTGSTWTEGTHPFGALDLDEATTGDTDGPCRSGRIEQATS